MKKLLLTILFLLIGFASLIAQNDRFGITAGYLSGNAKVNFYGEEAKNNESGFYGGLIIEIPLSEKFKIQPEFLYANIDNNSFLQIPIMAKLYAGDKFYFQAGPQITYTLEKIYDEFTKFNIALGGGVGYDIVSGLYVNAKYVFQLNNYFTGPQDFSSKIDFLNVGLGYKFN